MLEDLFLTILNVSAVTGAVILALVLLSPVINRFFAAKWRCIIWLLLALRLAVPLQLPVQEPAVTVSLPDVPVAVRQEPGAVRNAEIVPALPLPEESQNSLRVTELLAVLWLAGAGAVLLYRVSGYILFRKNTARWSRPVRSGRVTVSGKEVSAQLGIKKQIPVRVNEKVLSPMIIGIFRPVLLLPREDYPEQDLEYILRHELVHYMRRDLWNKLLFMLVGALYWFHPFIWLLARKAETDLELSCDDRVIGGRTAEECRAYSEAILSCVHACRTRRLAFTTYFNGGTRTMKQRFRNIFDKRKKYSGLLMAAAVLAGVLAAGPLVGFKTVEAGSAPAAENLEIRVQGCNVVLKVSDDGEYKYEIDERIHSLTAVQEDEDMRITLESTGTETPPDAEGMAYIYVPDNKYRSVTVDAKEAGIYIPSLKADFDVKASGSAVSFDASADFTGSVRLEAEECSGSLVLRGKDYDVAIDSDNSAVSVPRHFKVYAYQPGYRYAQGEGGGQFEVILRESAFSVAEFEKTTD